MAGTPWLWTSASPIPIPPPTGSVASFWWSKPCATRAVSRSLSLADGTGRRLSQYRVKDTSLTVSLPQELAPGEKLQLSLSYTLRLLDTQKLPLLRPYPLGYTSVQTNLGDWYPFIPPYLPGTGWLVHPPTTFGEYLVYDIADFDVAIRFADGQNNLVIAAGAPAVEDGEWQRFSHPAARSFAWSVSPYYQVAHPDGAIG